MGDARSVVGLKDPAAPSPSPAPEEQKWKEHNVNVKVKKIMEQTKGTPIEEAVRDAAGAPENWMDAAGASDAFKESVDSEQMQRAMSNVMANPKAVEVLMKAQSNPTMLKVVQEL